MKYNFIIYNFFFIALFSLTTSVHAVEWGNAPLACLPSRAEKWKNTDDIPLCHCPPQRYCPNYEAIKPDDVDLIVEWHWSNGITESGKLSGNDIPNVKNGQIKVSNIFKYTPEEMKEIVAAPLLKKFKIDTKKATDLLKGYVKDTKVTILLKPNSTLEGWINDTLKLPIDLASRCCESICPVGLIPVYQETEVVDPNVISKPQYIMTVEEFNTLTTDFKDIYQAIFNLYYTTNLEYNASIYALTTFYETQTSTPNLENLLNVVKNFLARFPQYKLFFSTDQYDLLIDKFTELQKTLEDELARRKEPTQYTTVKAMTCQVTTTYSREGCLHGGTKITMADGTTKPIEELKLGDEVKGNHGAAKIVALSKFTQKEDRMYSINGGKAFFTVEHPVLTPEGWKSVDSTVTSVKSNAKIIGTLRVGDIILMEGGKQLKVTSIKEELLKGGIDAYNLSVTGDGSFIANGFIMKSFKQMQMHY